MTRQTTLQIDRRLWCCKLWLHLLSASRNLHFLPSIIPSQWRSFCLTLPEQTYFPLHSVVKFTFILWLLKRENSKQKKKTCRQDCRPSLSLAVAVAEAKKISVQTDFLACLFYYAVDVLSAHKFEAQQVIKSRKNFLQSLLFSSVLPTGPVDRQENNLLHSHHHYSSEEVEVKSGFFRQKVNNVNAILCVPSSKKCPPVIHRNKARTSDLNSNSSRWFLPPTSKHTFHVLSSFLC